MVSKRIRQSSKSAKKYREKVKKFSFAQSPFDSSEMPSTLSSEKKYLLTDWFFYKKLNNYQKTMVTTLWFLGHRLMF